MPDDRMALLELAEKHGDGDFLRAVGQYVLQQLMELEAQQRCGAGLHVRSADQVNERDGYRERKLGTRKVDDLVQALGIRGVTKFHVSWSCGELDQQVKRLLERGLTDRWP